MLARVEDPIEVARTEGERAGLTRGFENGYKRGNFSLAPLDWDEHRDVSATEAEYRTNDMAVRLSYSDPDGVHTIEVVLRRWYGQRRFQIERSTWAEAVEVFDRMIGSFGRPKRFVTRVDY